MIPTLALIAAFVVLLALRRALRNLAQWEISAVNGFPKCPGCGDIMDPRVTDGEVCGLCQMAPVVSRPSEGKR
jgi:hypothetical protein